MGYIWFTYVASEGEPIAEMHICSSPDVRGRWLTRRVVQYGFDVIKKLKVGYTLAVHPDPTLRKALNSLGFKSHGAFINILKTEDIPSWDS